MKIALCQLNPTVGDLPGNVAKISDFLARAKALGADVALLSELALTGSPPRDLLLKEAFLDDQDAALSELAAGIHGITAVVGMAARHTEDKRLLYNSAAVIADGRIIAVGHKRLLPNYDIFDDRRYFTPGSETLIFTVAGMKAAVTICEDAWNEAGFWSTNSRLTGQKTYEHNPIEDCARAGAQVILNLSASPFQAGKCELRRRMLSFAAAKYGLPLAFTNQVGGNDEFIFDGASLGVSGKGRITACCRSFEEDLVLFDTHSQEEVKVEQPSPPEEVFRALVLGVRDYMEKCAFESAIVGLSGGIDSALVCVIAAEALGRRNVSGVIMPSMHTSESSLADANALAASIGISTVTVPITPVYDAFMESLHDLFKDEKPGIAEENIQARARATILMAISNKFGGMVLATGNKSEVSVGYCTLYGDMAGGLDVLGDVPKTLVWEMSRWINTNGVVIPPVIIEKAPSAELAPGQTDQDTLPPYDVLDEIVRLYIEEERGAAEIIRMGYDREVVASAVRMIDTSEYKRRQSAPVLKVTGRAFGFGRRMPIAQRYREVVS